MGPGARLALAWRGRAMTRPLRSMTCGARARALPLPHVSDETDDARRQRRTAARFDGDDHDLAAPVMRARAWGCQEAEGHACACGEGQQRLEGVLKAAMAHGRAGSEIAVAIPVAREPK